MRCKHQEEDATLKVYGLVDDSIVDGPGIRLAVFAQGCPHRCPGCHNPEAQPFAGGTPMTVAELMEKVRANPLLTGITLTGGEPFAQAEALLAFVQALRALDRPGGRALTVWAYSGYTFEELEAGAAARALLHACDVLVDGPYLEAQRSLDLRWKGSANQRVIDVPASLALGEPVDFHPSQKKRSS